LTRYSRDLRIPSSSQGEFPIKKGGVIMGHEISGIVADVGSNVNHVKPGDDVGVDPNRFAGNVRFVPENTSHYYLSALLVYEF
jgi:D-arabinose 1-dehydrogenase-like Zn-dependent alcohol dehydrogenase